MRVGHDGGGPERHDSAGKFRWNDHGAFEVDMAVNESGTDILTTQVYLDAAFIISETHNNAVIYCNTGFMNVAGENVDDLRVVEDEVGWFFTVGNLDLFFKTVHDAPPQKGEMVFHEENGEYEKCGKYMIYNYGRVGWG